MLAILSVFVKVKSMIKYLCSVWKNRATFFRMKGAEWDIRRSLKGIGRKEISPPEISPQELQGM